MLRVFMLLPGKTMMFGNIINIISKLSPTYCNADATAACIHIYFFINHFNACIFCILNCKWK